MLAFLDRERTIAGPGFSRWLVPPAALSIHLAIGQAYAFSVFNIPLETIIGITKPAPDDWAKTTDFWVFSVAIVVLGLSAAIFGKWLEAAGPRKAMFASACCFGGGFLVSAVGIHFHQFALMLLGYGVLGGIGLGLGYISPVSTLIKWFPDRPGMATGMAIMGFGGAAMIGGPLAVMLMKHFAGPTTNGVEQAFIVMGIAYFLFMLFGAATVRVPPPGWKPAGFMPSVQPMKLVTAAQVTADEAIKTPQFYLLWGILFLNVSASIGILQSASPMIRDIFKSREMTAAAASGFVSFLSFFNMGGRFFWSSLSDYIGRKSTYFLYFLLGASLYCLMPTAGHAQSLPLFVAGFAVILSMYGGGFATVPAYLRDLFGTMQVGAIHGRLLTAWSAAGIAGPALVNYVQQYQVNHGVSPDRAYDLPMYIMAGLLVVGGVCNFLVTPVDSRHNFAARIDASKTNPSSTS